MIVHGCTKTDSSGRKKKPLPRKSQKLKSTTNLSWSYTPPRQQTKEIKSLETKEQFTAKPEKKEYTGDLIKGISTMHKSNAVPIISKQEAVDISKMRR